MIFLFLPAKRQAASERRSRQAQKWQDTEQTHVTAVTTGMARFRCCQNPVHLNLGKTEDIPCNSLDTCKIRHLYRKHTRFRCFNGAIGTNGKCAAESTPDGVWQKWLRKSPMHLNAGAGRRESGKALSKRMLQPLRQEWPGSDAARIQCI